MIGLITEQWSQELYTTQIIFQTSLKDPKWATGAKECPTHSSLPKKIFIIHQYRYNTQEHLQKYVVDEFRVGEAHNPIQG